MKAVWSEVPVQFLGLRPGLVSLAQANLTVPPLQPERDGISGGSVGPYNEYLYVCRTSNINVIDVTDPAQAVRLGGDTKSLLSPGTPLPNHPVGFPSLVMRGNYYFPSMLPDGCRILPQCRGSRVLCASVDGLGYSAISNEYLYAATAAGAHLHKIQTPLQRRGMVTRIGKKCAEWQPIPAIVDETGRTI
jgi:hypothetical protein